MRFSRWLDAISQTQVWFAEESGLARSTVGSLYREEGNPRIDICDAVVETSKRFPAEDGSHVTYKDLLSTAETGDDAAA